MYIDELLISIDVLPQSLIHTGFSYTINVSVLLTR